MTRKKVKLAFLTNNSTRKATYKKRKKGLMKKVNELSTLCGIDACAIIYSPYKAQPDIWPTNIGGVHHVLAQFTRMPEMERSKNTLTQESFIKKQINKANEQLKKQMKWNREKEMTEAVYQCLTGKGSIANLSLQDLNDLGKFVDQNLKDISRRIKSLEEVVPIASPPAPPTPPLPPPPPPPQMSGGGNSSNATNEMRTRSDMVDNVSGMDRMRRTRWFADLINNPSEFYLGVGPGYVMTQFVDNHNPIWPNPYFP